MLILRCWNFQNHIMFKIRYKISLRRKHVWFISRHVCHKSLTCLWGSRPWQPSNYLFCRLLRLFGLQGIILDNITLFAPCIVAPIGLFFGSTELWQRIQTAVFSFYVWIQYFSLRAMRERWYLKNMPKSSVCRLRGQVLSCANYHSNCKSAYVDEWG